MKVFWKYRCDLGHVWTFFREENVTEKPEDIFCPEGHEAVTLQKDCPVDEVEITLRPAARIADKVTGKILFGGRYYLVLTDIQKSFELNSQKTYKWEEILPLAYKFHGLPINKAKGKWCKINP